MESGVQVGGGSNTLLIVVTGLPGTGKTTLAHGLARELGLPLVWRDGLKEVLYEGLGWSDREWTRKLGAISYGLLYHVARQVLAGGVSLIVESNFDPQWSTRELTELANGANARLAQVFCHTDGAVLLQRVALRSTTGERHPGHLDQVAAHELAERLQKPEFLRPLAIDGPVIDVDSTDFANADPALIAAELRRALNL